MGLLRMPHMLLLCRCAIAAMQEAWPQRHLVIYSGDGLTADELAQNALQTFSIALKANFQVSLSCWGLCLHDERTCEIDSHSGITTSRGYSV